MKRGRRFVHGDKELVEKLGRNDPCPCGSTRRFKTVLPAQRPPRRRRTARLSTGIERPPRTAAPGTRGGVSMAS
ncbi:MAG: SEC-C domain-containing protein [Xanthomonadales bacterium]|nr:SEC-C domain-containing protein [Xanthomonadales bacterium]